VKIFVDHDIDANLDNNKLLANLSAYNRDLVRPASLDLSVGLIYVPGVDADKPGGINSPRSQHSLVEGGTAVIETAEEIKLADNQLGIVFLPSSDSSRGLLTTNPGLVDPGYTGKLHLTLINMGKNPFEISKGKRIMRVVIFELDSSAKSPISGNGSTVTAELLDRLSYDFLSVDKRVEKEVTRQDIKTRRWQVFVPVVIAVLTLAGAVFSNWTAEARFGERITKLEQQVADQKDSSKINTEISDIDARLKGLEVKAQTKSSQNGRP
jgi:deoxycytidine triphosphate deaminase